MKKIILFLFLVSLLCVPPALQAKTKKIREGNPEPVVRVYVAGRRHRGIKTLPLETYLAGVIGNEMSRRWPVEALKAQAVAARSYALYRMEEAHRTGKKFDVLANQGDQVFRMRDIQNPYLDGIVESTRGEVLWKNGRVVEAFYSSTCGGRTRSASEAGLSSNSPLKGMCTDSYCRTSPFRNWRAPLTLAEMEKKLHRAGIKVSNLREVRVKKKEKSGYVRTVELIDDHGRRTMPSRQFRKIMGVMRVKSVLFDITQTEDGTCVVDGNGFGHGVGLCQYGAKQMAMKGHRYKSILAKYYPKIPISKIY